MFSLFAMYGNNKTATNPHVCPVRAAASLTKIKILQTLQNKRLRMSLKADISSREISSYTMTEVYPTTYKPVADPEIFHRGGAAFKQKL